MGNIIKKDDLDIGAKIIEVLKERKMKQADLARAAGISQASVSYLMTRHTVDVRTLVRVSRALGHNFLQYYFIPGAASPRSTDASNLFAEKEKAYLAEKVEREKKIAELEKLLAEQKEKTGVMQMENDYLKEINRLLKKKRE